MKSADPMDTTTANGAQEPTSGTRARHAGGIDDLLRHVLESQAESSTELRVAASRAAGLPQHLAVLVEKIHKHSYKVVDADVDAARAASGEDEIFEVILSACIGASQQRALAGLRALEEAT